ncbi:MAG: hypothetical protein DWQ49_09855 [Bacteroidetes bacterium]|nr:MAG: hypothetical protein DWQ49_09855 [Bacteroidota bacterium]
MAIKSQYQGEDGLKIWDDWSAQGSRYKQNECHIRWDGFDDFGEIRIGTLFFFAKDSGWEPTKDDVKANKYDELVEKMNKTYAIVMVGGKIRILREKSELSQATGECYDLLGKEDFKTLLQNDTIEVADAKGRVKNISVANIWLAHGGRRTYPNGMGLFPEGAPLGWYNTWTGFSVEPIKGQCDLFLDHVKEVICNGNVDYYNWVIDWCADCIQDPSNPKGTAIVLRGEEGAGKGTLANTIGQLFGSHYRHLIDDSHLLSNFNAHMIDALFVFADEITWGGNIKTSGKLKGMVTEKYLIGERKGVDAVGYRNMIHMMIASNSSWVIPAGTNSRRWFVLDVSDKKVNDTSYFNAIQDELNNGGLEALLYYLLNRKITNNLRRALETKALQEQRARGQSGDSVLQWWLNALYSEVIEVMDEREIDPSNDLSWPFIVNKINLYKDYKEWCETNGHKFLSMNVFFVEIQRFGFIKSRPSIKGKRIQVYQIPTIEEAKDLMKSKYNIDVDGDDNDQ